MRDPAAAARWPRRDHREVRRQVGEMGQSSLACKLRHTHTDQGCEGEDGRLGGGLGECSLQGSFVRAQSPALGHHSFHQPVSSSLTSTRKLGVRAAAQRTTL